LSGCFKNCLILEFTLKKEFFIPKKLFISLLLFSILFSSIVFASKAPDEPEVELVSKDTQKFRVKRKVILQSGLIKDMLEEQEEEDMPSIHANSIIQKFKKP